MMQILRRRLRNKDCNFNQFEWLQKKEMNSRIIYEQLEFLIFFWSVFSECDWMFKDRFPFCRDSCNNFLVALFPLGIDNGYQKHLSLSM